MKRFIIILITMFSFFSNTNSKAGIAYDFHFDGIDGNPIKLKIGRASCRERV